MPQISVTFAFVLALASVLALVLFLAHLAREIRVETMLRKVHAEAEETLRRVLPRLDADKPVEVLPDVPPDAVTLVADTSGFMIGLDEDEVLAAAVATDAVVFMERTPGASLVAGTPVAFSWPVVPGQRLGTERVEQLQQQVAGAVSVRFEHTSAQDITYGLRQLTDVANKALSPGINDPTTANHALAHTSGLLCMMVAYDLGPWMRRDDDGRLRVILCRPGLVDLLELALAGPRRYGSADPNVLARLFTLLRELAWSTDVPAHRQAIRSQLSRLSATASEQDFDPAEQARLTRLHERVDAALSGVWRPDPPNDVAAVEHPA